MAEDLKGQKFGRLTVLRRGENDKTKHVRWWCQCECGNKTLVAAGHLKSGHTQSCGCFHKDKMKDLLVKDLLNKRFGKLLVTDKLYIKNKRQYWKCKCDCGKDVITSSVSLTTGGKKSCGCLVSVAEYELEEFLKQETILYQRQYKFKDCKNIRVLPFDFGIFHPATKKLMFLVELHGEQHYYPFTFNNESQNIKEENLKNRMEMDSIKNNFCINNKIPLLIIKYTNFDVKNDIFKKFYDNCLESKLTFDDFIYQSQNVKNNFQIRKKKIYKRKVIQIDIFSRTVIAKYSSLKEAYDATGVSSGQISDCCKRKQKTAGGFAWAYDNANFDIDNILKFVTTPNRTRAIAVYQKNKDGTILKKWESITQAAQHLNTSHQNIQACCAGKQKTCKGFIWERAN